MMSSCLRFSVNLEQVTVTLLIEENKTINDVHYKNKANEELEAIAHFTIVCNGFFSNLTRSLCNPKVAILIVVARRECVLSLGYVNNMLLCFLPDQLSK